MISIGKRIQTRIIQLMERHLKRLVTAAGLQNTEMWQLAITIVLRLFSKVLQQSGKEHTIMYAPFALSFTGGEIIFRHNGTETRRTQIRAHISKVGITTIIVTQIIARQAQHIGNGWQMLRLARIFHQAHCRSRRIAT